MDIVARINEMYGYTAERIKYGYQEVEMIRVKGKSNTAIYPSSMLVGETLIDLKRMFEKHIG